jgi:hypothetical protein
LVLQTKSALAPSGHKIVFNFLVFFFLSLLAAAVATAAAAAVVGW